jgi:hypothetical protein
VADPDHDGWSTGTPPYFGDYFLPGTPYEGYSIQINGSRADAFNPNTSGFTSTLTGNNVSDTFNGTSWVATWQGLFDSMAMKQVVTLDTANLYFRVDVTLTNMSSSALNNIYYMRSVDPDNEQVQTGSFSTNNVIRFQGPDTTLSLVTATGVTYTQAYLGLGSTDSNSRVMIFSSWPLVTTVDLATIYHASAGSTFYMGTGDSLGNQDVAIGIIFNVPHLAPLDSASVMVNDRTTATGPHPANSKTMSYFYSFSKAATDSVIQATSAHVPTAIVDVNNSQISVYPNPAKSEVNLTGLAKGDRVRILDMMGRTISGVVESAANGHQVISVREIPTGHYVLVVADASGNTRTRVPFEKI